MVFCLTKQQLERLLIRNLLAEGETIDSLHQKFNRSSIIWSTAWFVTALPWVLVLLFFSLCIIIYRTQRMVWDLDMKHKTEAQAEVGM